MDNCEFGCPCEDNHYNCTLYTTGARTTTTAYPSPTTDAVVSTTPVLDIDDDYIDDLTAGKLVTIGKK